LGAEELTAITTKDLLLHNLWCKSSDEQVPDLQTKKRRLLSEAAFVRS
jgi:hypothetical protein